MKRLGIDLDDVLNCFNEGWIAAYNNLSGDALTVEDITAWDIDRFVKPKWKGRIFPEIVLKPGFFAGLPEREGAADFLKWACARFDTCIVSASQCATVPEKAEWLRAHFPFFQLENFIPCWDKSLLRLDFLLDDGPHNALACCENARVLLFDRPWNAGLPLWGKQINRVFHFADAKRILERVCC
mgnify:CR=1 FL=1